jgi:Outer membrane lipoprotein carrier protein LolA-like
MSAMKPPKAGASAVRLAVAVAAVAMADVALVAIMSGTAAGATATPTITAAAAGANSELDRVMAKLAQRRHSQAEFTERQYLAVLNRPIDASGTLLYDAPDHLEKRTLLPKPSSLTLQGSQLTVVTGKHRHVMDLAQYPDALAFIASIRSTLAGDRAGLERIFSLDFTGTFDRWTLELAPLDRKLARTVAHIRIDGEGDAVHTVEIRQSDGDRSVMSIRALESP